MPMSSIQSNLLRLARTARDYSRRADCSFSLLPYADADEIKRQIRALMAMKVTPNEDVIDLYSHCLGLQIGEHDLPLLAPATLPLCELGQEFGWDCPSVMGDLHIWPENQAAPGEQPFYTAVLGHTPSATLTLCADGLCSTHKYGSGVIPKPQHFCLVFEEAFERYVRLACRDMS